MSAHITGVTEGSLAARYGIPEGSELLKINGHDITDVLDYRFYMVDTVLRIVYKTPEGKFTVIKMVKEDEYDDIGLEFETYLMDKQHSCRNKCIFCFVDQLPKNMRESLYFKDDDSRLSFFYGNYITLTNLTDADVDRIINMHISPVNISVHTMNPELRVKMMNNKNAGKALEYLKRLAASEIVVNTQLVLCPGINDGKELEYSLEELAKLAPGVQSIACVPVGLTDHREGLFPLKMYTKEQAYSTIETIESYAKKFKKELGNKLCYAADEFYIKAGLPFPEDDYYDGYPQLDNGVGLCRLLETEVFKALEDMQSSGELEEIIGKSRGCKEVVVSIATGSGAYTLIKDLGRKVEDLYNDALTINFAEKILSNEDNTQTAHKLKVNVYEIKNDFFGKNITVAGLLTGADLKKQLKDEKLGNALLLSESMLRTTYPQNDPTDDDVFLDDMTTGELGRSLDVPVKIVKNDGYEFVKSILEVVTCQDQ